MEETIMRIAFFGDDFSRQGKGTALVIQKITEEIVEHHARTVEVVLLRPAGPCESPVCETVQHVVIRRRFSTLLSYLWFFISHRGRYDAIVFNRVVYPGFFFLKAKKRVLFLHDASLSEVYTVPRTWVNRVFEIFLKYVGQYFLDIVIGDSENARTWIIRYYGIPERKTRKLFLAAGDEYVKYGEEERKKWTEHISNTYDIGMPYILDVSRFDPHKNIENVLEAFFELKEQRIPHTLVFVGGAHTPAYSRLIYDKIARSPFSKDVRIVDYVPQSDMPAFYACADLLVYPSLVEGFGLPLLEAMKSGTPVVTSNISSMPEIAGDAAILVDPSNVHAIAEGVKRVLDDKELRAQLITKGVQRASVFSWGKTAQEFLDMIRSVQK